MRDPRTRRLLAAALLAVAAVAAGLVTGGGAAGLNRTAVGTPGTVKLIATVDVASLPAPPAATRARPVPVFGPGAVAGGARPAPEPAAGAVPASAPTLKAGKRLPG